MTLMSSDCTRLIFSLLLLVVCYSGADAAGGDTLSDQIEEAEDLIRASRNDAALVLLDRLRSTNSTLTTTGGASREELEIDLLRTKALTKKRDYATAAEELLHLIDAARNERQPYVEARALIGMAYILSRQSSPEKCLEYLNEADRLIRTHTALQPLSAEHDNRRAAYERLYGDREEALRYANRALVSAREHQDSHQLALAHALLSALKRKRFPQESEYHLVKAAEYYHHTGSDVDYLVMTIMLNRLQQSRGRFTEALASNDSAMVYVNKVERGDSTYLSQVYELRANLFHRLGRHDSAWHYLNLANTSRLQQLKQINDNRAVEVEARYSIEKKSLLIAEQQRTIVAEQRRRNMLIYLTVGGLSSFLVLAFYYSRLRRAKSKLEKQYALQQQNEELSTALAQQKILQGEVHHRVKNNLQVIISLLELQREEISDENARSAFAAMSGRIFSMAAVHETLYQDGNADEIDFSRYTEKICRHFDAVYLLPTPTQFSLSLDGYFFNLETAIPMGTVLNELLTNSFKYAPRQDRILTITLEMVGTDGELCLTYRDNGPGFPAGSLQEREGGLGSYLLHGMSRQLRGRVVTYNDNGAVTKVYFRRKNDHRVGKTRSPGNRTQGEQVSVA